MPITSYSFQTTAGVVASSSGSGWHPFGLRARTLHIDNLNTVPLYVRVDVENSTSCALRASTTDITVWSCTGYNWADFDFGARVRVNQITVMATSTSASGINIRAIG